jgi:hypothetical protein
MLEKLLDVKSSYNVLKWEHERRNVEIKNLKPVPSNNWNTIN